MSAATVCFGELLLRLSAPDNQRLSQLPGFDVHVGGAEANVAVSLAQFQHTAHMVSALPNSPLSDAVIQDLRSHGVKTQSIQRASGRLGLYFLETGAVRRPSRIVYDRAGSAFVEIDPEAYDWESILKDADWLHISGITPATGPHPAQAALAAMRAATELDLDISFDGNYREQLWASWSGDGPSILAEMLSHATVAFINELDVGLIHGETFSTRAEAEKAAFDRYPGLKYIASTHRSQLSADHHRISGRIASRDRVWITEEMDLAGIKDRIGGGDAYAAGIIHGLKSGMSLQETVGFATAAAAIKHSIHGDYNRTSVEEVEDLLAQNGLDVRR